MLRVVLYVALLGALFAGAVLWTGNAIGAWEPPTVPLHAPTLSTETPAGKKHQPKKHHAPVKKPKKH
jgi:hypothetical protein